MLRASRGNDDEEGAGVTDRALTIIAGFVVAAVFFWMAVVNLSLATRLKSVEGQMSNLEKTANDAKKTADETSIKVIKIERKLAP